jgi:hypothetical protein
MGFDQKAGVAAAARAFPGYDTISFVKDLAGHDRVAHFKKKLINTLVFDIEYRIFSG